VKANAANFSNQALDHHLVHCAIKQSKRKTFHLRKKRKENCATKKKGSKKKKLQMRIENIFLSFNFELIYPK
jgi:hypothetical protein